ncbi:hypothetical protein ACGFZR_20445 [Streptomyces sp. NPDC048241]|uniref:hypothetical protein n=1 Tax=Streptomyces sp. NPDC048241 TaxID=3365521 RepID=UPI0037244F8D
MADPPCGERQEPVGKSATILGREMGRTGQQMNELLYMYGYLDGRPGAYFLTPKGEQFGTEKDHDRGNPGSLSYYRQWTTITWNDETLPALLWDMENTSPRPAPSRYEGEDDREVAENAEPAVDQEQNGSDVRAAVALAVIMAGTTAAAMASPYVQRWWRETARPSVSRVRRKLSRKQPPEDPHPA